MTIKKNFTIQEETFEALLIYAKREKRSMSNVVDMALEEFFKKNENNLETSQSLEERISKLTNRKS